MTETELFYWLQGFFELTLCDGSALLSKARAECVKRHIALTRAALRRGQQLGERVARIELCVEMILDSQEATQGLTRRIQSEVNAQFVHVIDPKAGDAEQQAKFNEIHSPGPGIPGQPVMRC
jgi:hypothetical protein